jgi:RNA polymerase sigma-70 factor (ECF subfamily)
MKTRCPLSLSKHDKSRVTLINGAAGVVITVRGRPFAAMGFTVAQGKIVEIDAIADPARVKTIAAVVLNDEGRSI